MVHTPVIRRVGTARADLRIEAGILRLCPDIPAREHQLHFFQGTDMDKLRHFDCQRYIPQAKERGTFIEIVLRAVTIAVLAAEFVGIGAAIVRYPCLCLSADGDRYRIIAMKTVPVHPFLGLIVQMTAIDPIELEVEGDKFIGNAIDKGNIELGVRVAKSIGVVRKLYTLGCRIDDPSIDDLVFAIKRLIDIGSAIQFCLTKTGKGLGPIDLADLASRGQHEGGAAGGGSQDNVGRSVNGPDGRRLVSEIGGEIP